MSDDKPSERPVLVLCIVVGFVALALVWTFGKPAFEGWQQRQQEKAVDIKILEEYARQQPPTLSKRDSNMLKAMSCVERGGSVGECSKFLDE